MSRNSYNVATGDLEEAAYPSGMVARQEYDVAGRLIRFGEDFGTGTALNKTTEFVYDSKGRLSALIAKNSVTGDQNTEFTYGTEKGSSASDVARADLVKTMVYPDSGGASDLVTFSYNRLGQVKQKTDPAGTVHDYAYDLFGRWTVDSITAFPNAVSGVNNAVLRISRTFERRGRIETVSSFSTASGGSSSNLVNEVKRVYNDYRQLITEYQEHGGGVNTSTSRKVQYGYATPGGTGTALTNTARRTSITYPIWGKSFDYNYGTAYGADDMTSRVNSIWEGASMLALYAYLGWEHRAEVSYLEVPGSFKFTRIQQSDELTTGDGGDKYIGWDRVGRSVQMRWQTGSSDSSSSTTVLERTQYGYDAAANRIWRKEAAAPGGAKQDEAYQYDKLSQLTQLQRGTLNSSYLFPNPPGSIYTTAGTPTFEEKFTFDPTGNSHKGDTTNTGAYTQKAGGSTQVDQNRTHNKANEIVSLSASAPTGTSAWAGPFTMMRLAIWPPTLCRRRSTPPGPVPTIPESLVRASIGTSAKGSDVYDGLDRRVLKPSTPGENPRLLLLRPVAGAGVAFAGASPDQRRFLWGCATPMTWSSAPKVLRPPLPGATPSMTSTTSLGPWTASCPAAVPRPPAVPRPRPR
ncbi:MAG: RHS repeat domain-containing protein [Bryobacteraceae bacterium]